MTSFHKYKNTHTVCLQDLSNETFMEDTSGKHLPLVDILSLSIKYMKEHALKYLADTGVPYPEAETKWVITVPAIWSDPAKVLMRNAAEKVSLFLLPFITIV